MGSDAGRPARIPAASRTSGSGPGRGGCCAVSQPQLEIQLIAMVTAVACALPGAFLVLRRMALMSDAISHSILLGIVLAFFVVGTVGSPLLILGAAVMGLV